MKIIDKFQASQARKVYIIKGLLNTYLVQVVTTHDIENEKIIRTFNAFKQYFKDNAEMYKPCKLKKVEKILKNIVIPENSCDTYIFENKINLNLPNYSLKIKDDLYIYDRI